MLQYLINDNFPGFNLPKLCTSLEGVSLNSLTLEIRRSYGDHSLITDQQGMIALYHDNVVWTWVLYNDLTFGLMGSDRRFPLTYEEGVSRYLQV
jgi:hypothetical protein